ncbi:hypothetical protein GF318_00120 [Candidatus Micrarchaeota archaeon]|nr:hypothetical protein [Candidatus Micrarchaeota archaeon]
MRTIILAFISLLMLGCIIGGEEGNQTNVSEDNASNITEPVNVSNAANATNATNQTNGTQPSRWERYQAGEFSFEYPVRMETQGGAGLFTGEHSVENQTNEALAVMYYNTSAVYGRNQDKEFKETPSETATLLLEDDIGEDPIMMLHDAEEIGGISEFSIGRDAYVSQAPFKIRFFESGKLYNGYALSIYVPERSLHVKFRVIALNPQLAKDIKDQFLLSFRLE